MEEKSKKVDYPAVALTDKQAVLIDGRKHKIVGTGRKHIFNALKNFNL